MCIRDSLKMAQIISVGTSLKDFLRLEFERLKMSLESEYERRINKMKTFVDAYSAMLSAISFISLAMLITSLVFAPRPPQDLMLMAIFLVVSLQTATTLLVNANAPYDRIPHQMEGRPAELKRAELLNKTALLSSLALLVASLVLASLSYLAEIELGDNLYLFLSLSGVPSFLAGVIGRKCVKEVKRREEYFPIFIKTFGEAASVVGISPLEVVRTIIYNDFGTLNKLVKRFYKRLKMGIDKKVAWRFFEAESGSSLIARGIEVYEAATEVGGDPKEVSNRISDFSLLILLLRRKREQIAGYAKGLLIPLHAATVGVFSLLRALLAVFMKLSSLVSPYLNLIAFVPMSLVDLYLLIVISSLIIGTSLTLYFIDGESPFSLSYYSGVLLLITGAVFLLVSKSASSLLGMFAGFGSQMEGLVS